MPAILQAVLTVPIRAPWVEGNEAMQPGRTLHYGCMKFSMVKTQTYTALPLSWVGKRHPTQVCHINEQSSGGIFMLTKLCMKDNLERKMDVKNKHKLSLYRNSAGSYTVGISTPEGTSVNKTTLGILPPFYFLKPTGTL